MNKHTSPEETASKRMMLLSPLIEEGLDEASIIDIKKRIAAAHNLSYRTVSRYHQAYLESGFEGLKPKTGYKRSTSTLVENFNEVVEQAIALRRELPSRSVKDIIRILELEELIKPGSVHRSTLQRHLQAAGFGAAQVKLYTQRGAAAIKEKPLQKQEILQPQIIQVFLLIPF